MPSDRDREARLSRVIALGVRRQEMELSARSAVSAARKAGRLKKRCCTACGAEKSVGHHVDYGKPLLLIWLCHSCHSFVHRRLEAPTVRGPLALQSPILEALGRRLRGAFALADLSPTKAAVSLGVKAATVRRWLANPGEVKAKIYLDLCTEADADGGELLTEAIEDARQT